MILATGGYDNILRLWDVATGRKRAELAGHTGWIESLAFSPDGRVIASGGLDGVRLWDVAARQGTAKLDAGQVLAVAYAPDGNALATGAEGDGAVIIWDIPAKKVRARLAGLPGDDVVLALAFSPDGGNLAAATIDKETQPSLDLRAIRSGNGSTITIWEVARGREPAVKHRFKAIIEVVWALAFSPDGRTLAAATGGKEVRLWDLPAAAERPPLRGHRRTVHGVAFSPDRKTLASGSLDGQALGSDQGRRTGDLPRPHQCREVPGVLSRRPDDRFGELGQHGAFLGCRGAARSAGTAACGRDGTTHYGRARDR
jgi:WD40 repeat protein